MADRIFDFDDDGRIVQVATGEVVADEFAGPRECRDLLNRFAVAQWQPIETAPKDETTLALFGRWFGDPEVRIGRWLSSPIDGYDGDWSIEYEPTHYIVIPTLPTPLPADPQDQSGSAG